MNHLHTLMAKPTDTNQTQCIMVLTVIPSLH